MSARYEMINENNHYLVIKVESMYTFKGEKLSQRCKRRCSKKLKIAIFKIITK